MSVHQVRIQDSRPSKELQALECLRHRPPRCSLHKDLSDHLLPGHSLPVFALPTFLSVLDITSVWNALILVNVKKVWILLATREPVFLSFLTRSFVSAQHDLWQTLLHSAELAMSSHYIAWEAILDFRREQNTKLGLLQYPLLVLD